MRGSLMMAATAVALSLSACTETGETYPVDVGDAWSKLESAGYAASAFGVPSSQLALGVQARFEPLSRDWTPYWAFTRNGKELGRLNVAVEGDRASSTVSYSYASGNVAEDDPKIEQAVRQFAQPLFVEAVDAAIENRSPDQTMRNTADAESAAQLADQVVKETYSEIDKALKESDERLDAVVAEAEARERGETP